MLRLLCVLAVAQALAPAPPPGAGTEPLGLREAIAEAMLASPMLGAPHDNQDLARIRAKVAASSFRPQLSPSLRASTAGAGVLDDLSVGLDITQRLPLGTELRVSATGLQTSGPLDSRSAAYVVGISQPLLRGLGGAPAHALKQARRDVSASQRALVEVRQDLIVAVAGSFLDVLQLQRQASAAEQSIARAVTMVRASRARVKVGLATELDVSRAEYLAAQSEGVLLHQQEALGAALDTLRSILGRPADAPLTLVDADLERPQAILPDFVPPASTLVDPVSSLTALASAQRLDLREARDRIEDARRSRNLARWNLLPDVSVHASYSRAGHAASFLSLPPDGWRMGVSTGYEVMGSHAPAAMATAAIGLRASQRAALDAERRASDQVRRAHREWTRTAASIDLQTKAVALAARQVRLAEIRAERGIAGNFDLVDAESHLFEAQTALIAAQAARALAGLRLRHAVGSLDPAGYMK